MDYSAINQASWMTYLPAFKVLLRPGSASAPAMSVGAELAAWPAVLERARQLVPGFGDIGDKLVPLVFEGYQDWYSYEDQWILKDLASVLDDTGDQEIQILRGLDELGLLARGIEKASELTPDEIEARVQQLDVGLAANSLLTRLSQYVAAWQDEASRVGSEQQAAATTEGIPGDTNANWDDDAVPGTRYWIYADGGYLYSDRKVAPLDQWMSLQGRENAAEAAKQPWNGAPGWSCTPVGDESVSDYGGVGFVFRRDPDGSWMTQAKAFAALDQEEEEARLAVELTGELYSNWAQDRIPGTRCWVYFDNGHLFSDYQTAPLGRWAPLADREDRAEAAARPWQGAPGWSCTPVAADVADDYGGEGYVFRLDPDGPWMLMAAAIAAIDAAEAIEDDEAVEEGQDEVEPEAGKAAEPAEFAKQFAEVQRETSQRMPDAVAAIRAAGVDPEVTDDEIRRVLLSYVAAQAPSGSQGS